MKTQVKFVSKDEQLVVITITTGDYVSFTGDCGGFYGQCMDDFVPTETQQKLVDMWKAFHLKGVLSQENEKRLQSVLLDIENEERERKDKLNEDDGDYYMSKLTKRENALMDFLDLEPGDARYLEEMEDYRVGFMGRIYYVGTDRELLKVAKAHLMDSSELWQEAVKNGETELGLEDWAEEVVEMDGLGSILSYYDGREYEFGKYIICREQ